MFELVGNMGRRIAKDKRLELGMDVDQMINILRVIIPELNHMRNKKGDEN